MPRLLMISLMAVCAIAFVQPAYADKGKGHYKHGNGHGYGHSKHHYKHYSNHHHRNRNSISFSFFSSPRPYYYPTQTVYYSPQPVIVPQQVVFNNAPGYHNSYGQFCREYTSVVLVGGYRQDGFGTACLQPDGSWRIVN